MLIPTLFFVTTLVFFLLHIIPGDPVDFILGENAPGLERVKLVSTLKLDRPLWIQYSYFIKNVLSLNFGKSLFDGTPVATLIVGRIGPTFILAISSLMVALSIAIPFGFIAAVKKDSLADHGTMLFALLGISIPNFYLGPLLIAFFSIKMKWLPVSGMESIHSLILPAITLGTAMAAMTARMTRASMLDVMKLDFVKTARAKGLKQRVVFLKHVLRASLLPVLTVVGLQFGSLLAGAVVTEKIFNWPGMGTLLLSEIGRRNYPVVQGCVLVIAFTYILVNLLTDLVSAKLDPRIRLGEK